MRPNRGALFGREIPFGGKTGGGRRASKGGKGELGSTQEGMDEKEKGAAE